MTEEETIYEDIGDINIGQPFFDPMEDRGEYDNMAHVQVKHNEISND